MMIYMIGITGVGKSSIGKLLAARLKYHFVDLDAWIEIREQKTVSDLFQSGEDHFRKCETEALKSIDPKKKLVVATGGGIVTRKENVDWMRQHGFVIFLKRPIHKIAGKISTKKRPLLRENPNFIYQLYRERKVLYKRAAHIEINCSNRQHALNRITYEVKKHENTRHKRT